MHTQRSLYSSTAVRITSNYCIVCAEIGRFLDEKKMITPCYKPLSPHRHQLTPDTCVCVCVFLRVSVLVCVRVCLPVCVCVCMWCACMVQLQLFPKPKESWFAGIHAFLK